MTTELEVYLKNKPSFDSFLSEDVGMRLCRTDPKFCCRAYEWFPTKDKTPTKKVWVYEYFKPAPYSCYAYYEDSDIVDVTKRKAEQGFRVPKNFVRKVIKNGGSIVADREMMGVLEKNPKLEKMLPENEPLWGILRFTQGKPTYRVSLETKIHVTREVLSAFLNMAKFFAIRYKGIIWDPQQRQFGSPDAETLSQSLEDASRDFTSFIENAGFEWSPV